MNIEDFKKKIFADIEENNIKEIPINRLKSFEENPFRLCSKEDLEELAESIKD